MSTITAEHLSGTVKRDDRLPVTMTRHKEVSVKVNAFVDEGIAELVLALSEVPGLVTLESCQGDERGQDAYIFFRLGDWRQAGEFLFDRLLPAMTPDLRSMVALRLQAYDVRMARGSITLDPHAISSVTLCVRKALAAPVSPRAFVAGNAHGETIAETVVPACLD